MFARNLINWMASAVLLLSMAWLHAADFSDEEKEKAIVHVERLEAESFANREAAVNELKKLPSEALPWLEELIGATGPVDIDLRSRLKSVVRTLKKRSAEESLRSGTQVKIDLKDVEPDEVLAALKGSLGSSLTGTNTRGIWEKKTKNDFSFEGSFWEAVDAMLETFPPGRGEREDLSGEYRMGHWGVTDFKASENPSVNTGILRVRHARMALENNGGKDYLVVTLVPSVEPVYQVEALALLVKGLELEDGTMLVPEKKVQEWKAQQSGSRYSPGGVFTWTFPLRKGVDLGGVAGIEGVAEIKLRRQIWAEVDLPEDLNDPVKMNSNVELQVLERDEGLLKIQFKGKGSEPACFDDYELRKEAYQVLDADGKILKFSVNSSSSGGGDGWRNSYKGKIDGEPAKVRANLPGGEQKVQLEFRLSDLPMPGSSLVE
jgi:hypothetical protein